MLDKVNYYLEGYATHKWKILNDQVTLVVVARKK
jgi:hypothetical protein